MNKNNTMLHCHTMNVTKNWSLSLCLPVENPTSLLESLKRVLIPSNSQCHGLCWLLLSPQVSLLTMAQICAVCLEQGTSLLEETCSIQLVHFCKLQRNLHEKPFFPLKVGTLMVLPTVWKNFLAGFTCLQNFSLSSVAHYCSWLPWQQWCVQSLMPYSSLWKHTI